MLQTTGETTIVQNETIRGVSKEEHRRMEDWLKRKIDASKKEPSAEIVTLTPCLASLLLTRNKINRPVSERNSNFLASDIANGRWEFNGESIVVASSGDLIDGQHRCQQVVATSRAISTVMVFGPKERARFTIDTGKPKTAANFLAMKGYRYAAILSTVLNYLLQFREHRSVTSTGRSPRIPSTAEKLAAMEENMGIKGSIEFAASCTKTVRAHAVLAFCHYVFSKRAGRAAADEFILKIIEGENLKRGDPALYCRNRLPNLGRGATPNARIDLVFKCWNASREERRIDHCKLSDTSLPKVMV